MEKHSRAKQAKGLDAELILGFVNIWLVLMLPHNSEATPPSETVPYK